MRKKSRSRPGDLEWGRDRGGVTAHDVGERSRSRGVWERKRRPLGEESSRAHGVSDEFDPSVYNRWM